MEQVSKTKTLGIVSSNLPTYLVKSKKKLIGGPPGHFGHSGQHDFSLISPKVFGILQFDFDFLMHHKKIYLTYVFHIFHAYSFYVRGQKHKIVMLKWRICIIFKN